MKQNSSKNDYFEGIAITKINNVLINDPNLTYGEIGLLVYILSESSESINLKELVNSHKSTKTEIINMIKSLKTKGYFIEKSSQQSTKDYVFLKL